VHNIRVRRMIVFMYDRRVRSTFSSILEGKAEVRERLMELVDARLEAEGVHGDGWDPGVERTRGGPSSGKRATVLEASVEKDVSDEERAYLANLDR
jgi:hypothetical protein